MNKKFKIVFIIVILIPILAPIIYTSVNQIIENNREYYCDSEEHNLDKNNKTCSYYEEIEAEYSCGNDNYKYGGVYCTYQNTVKAEFSWRCSENINVCDEAHKYYLPSCPDGYVVAKDDSNFCVPLEEKDIKLYISPVPICPDGYYMISETYKVPVKGYDASPNGVYNNSSSNNKVGLYDERTIYKCRKEISYKAKWDSNHKTNVKNASIKTGSYYSNSGKIMRIDFEKDKKITIAYDTGCTEDMPCGGYAERGTYTIEENKIKATLTQAEGIEWYELDKSKELTFTIINENQIKNDSQTFNYR